MDLSGRVRSCPVGVCPPLPAIRGGQREEHCYRDRRGQDASGDQVRGRDGLEPAVAASAEELLPHCTLRDAEMARHIGHDSVQGSEAELAVRGYGHTVPKCSRITLGGSWSSKWQSTASLTISLRSSQSSPCVKDAVAERPSVVAAFRGFRHFEDDFTHAISSLSVAISIVRSTNAWEG